MIKRPLNSRFSGKVKAGIKITTIRCKPWPVGIPIMLYNWTAAAYRSKQRDVTPIIVYDTHPITITRTDDYVRFSIVKVDDRELWESEGFDSKEELHEWFFKALKPEQTVIYHLMRFRKLS